MFGKCCCCIDLSVGSFIVGYVKLIVDLKLVGLALVALQEVANLHRRPVMGANALKFKSAIAVDDMRCGLDGPCGNGVDLSAILAVILCLTLLNLMFTIVLLVGLHKNKPGCLITFLIYAVIFVLIYVSFFICSCFGLIFSLAKMSTFVYIFYMAVNIFYILQYIYYYLVVIRSMYYQMKSPTGGPAIYSGPGQNHETAPAYLPTYPQNYSTATNQQQYCAKNLA